MDAETQDDDLQAEFHFHRQVLFRIGRFFFHDQSPRDPVVSPHFG